MNLNPPRLISLTRLFAASVGAFVRWAWCQAAFWWRHLRTVRPSWRISVAATRVLQVGAELGDVGERDDGS